MKKVYVILVNWNGWADTLECLESLFRTVPSSATVIVCDNHSSDDSLQKISAWADGRIDIWTPRTNSLHNCSWPPVAKPLASESFDRDQAEKGGDVCAGDSRLVLIQTGANRGFAGGNNVGLKFALARGDFDYIWLLNNDTVVGPRALESMIERMEEKPDAGMCGSTLLHYDSPEHVQARGGGWYCKWIGLPWHLGRLGKASDCADPESVERRMTYVVGASMLISKPFLERVGLMDEDYFLFFEETDWAMRSKNLFGLAYARHSIVYHKVGRSIGTSSLPHCKSYVCDYFSVRNRLLFTKRYYPQALPVIYVSLWGALLLRILFGKWDHAKMIWKFLFGGNVEPPVKDSEMP